MNRFLVLLMSLLLALPVQALDLQGLYEQALTASRKGDFVEALPLWDRFLEQAPEDAAALSNRGNVRLALGDPSGAIDDQSASIVLAPEESDPHLNRGTAEEALQDWSAAADDYLWILERDPQDASALYNLANVRGSQGDWPEARELYGQAALARPGFATGSLAPQQTTESRPSVSEQGVAANQLAQFRLRPLEISRLPGRQRLAGAGHGEAGAGKSSLAIKLLRQRPVPLRATHIGQVVEG